MRYNAGMRQVLRLHPDSCCFAVTDIEVEVVRPRARTLVFTYAVTGRISDLVMPSVAAAVRTDELWRHTCFEAFVGSSADLAYYEFNFAPSRQWAAYQFSSYRSGMRVATEIDAPQIVVQRNPERHVLRASLDVSPLSLARSPKLRVGLSAVIEEVGGHRSYWALAHPCGKADFHHSNSFVLEVA